MSEVLVRGQAEGYLTPDAAVVHFTLVARDPGSAVTAMAAAAGTGRNVDAVLEDRRSVADPLVRRIRVSSVRTSELWEHTHGGRTRVGFEATRRTTVECRPDGAGLTDLVARVVAAGAQVVGPEWLVAPGNPGWNDLRRDAVADARVRAEVYAASAGHRVGVVRWLAEPGMRGTGTEGAGGAGERRALSMALGGRVDETVALQIAVEDVPVSVEVEVAYDLV